MCASTADVLCCHLCTVDIGVWCWESAGASRGTVRWPVIGQSWLCAGRISRRCCEDTAEPLHGVVVPPYGKILGMKTLILSAFVPSMHRLSVLGYLDQLGGRVPELSCRRASPPRLECCHGSARCTIDSRNWCHHGVRPSFLFGYPRVRLTPLSGV